MLFLLNIGEHFVYDQYLFIPFFLEKMARTKQSMRKTSRGQAPRMNPTKRLRPKQEDSDDPTDEGSPNPMEPPVEEMEDFEGYLSSPIQLTIGGSSPASSPQNSKTL